MDNVSDKFTYKTVQDSGREVEDERRYENSTSNINASDGQVCVNGVNDNREQDNCIQYRTKITPDGRIVRVILSDGETSSGIDSVSSVDSVNDFASNDFNAFMKNVLVEVKNEIAFEYSEGEMMKKIKKVSVYKEKFSKSLQDSDGVQPSYESHKEDFCGRSDESINNCEKQQNNIQRYDWSESRASSNKSDDRVLKKSKKSSRSRSSKRRTSKRSNSSDRSRSGSSPRGRLSSHERKKSKSSSERKNRSLSRRRPKSSSRRRSRSLSRRKSRSLSRRRSRSLSGKGRKSPSRRRSRSLSGKRRRSSSGRRRRSLSRERSRSLTRRRSRSVSRRSRSVTKKSSKSLSKKISKSRDGNSKNYGRNESGSVEEESSSSYYSKTETRKRRYPDGGFQSTTIQVHSGYFPPFVDRRPHYWRGGPRFPRGYVRGPYHPTVKRGYSTVTATDVNRSRQSKYQKKPNVELAKSDSTSTSSKEESQESQSETSSEVNVTLLTPETKAFSEERTLSETTNVPDYGSEEKSNYLPPVPKVGVDNLPLVAGPNGLPVHITSTGETIPYDMEGRRIPIGPNGHHLPLDVTGRLFPHVITQDNNAVPIYISEDGVLRLPDSRPVPFGSPHKLPVDIDGKMILMGPDSRPLVPHPNLPVEPPRFTTLAEKKPPTTKNENEQNNSGSYETDDEWEPDQKIIKNPEAEVVESNPSNDANEAKSIDSESDSDSTYFAHLLQKPIEKEPPVPSICSDPLVKKILDTIDANLLKKVQELTKEKPTQRIDDLLVNKIKAVLKTLYESKYQAPQYGRFILPKVMFVPTDSDEEFESPLWRNKIMLPFITPGAEDTCETEETEETIVPYTFVSPEKAKGNGKGSEEEEEEEEEVQIIEEYSGRDARQRKPKTACFGAQCDFTTDLLSESNLAVSKLKKEVVSLQNAYQTLFEMYERACAKGGTVPESME